LARRRPAVRFAGSAAGAGQFPGDGLPEVAFLGRSNVGKSSLLNALGGQADLARVSATPGRTRLVNFFRVDDELYFVDLPGYGYAKAPAAEREGWERLVTSYLLGREPLALCLFLVDIRLEAQANDETLRDFLDHHGLPRVVAATKADKLGRGEVGRRREAIRGGVGSSALDVIPVSARTGEGIDELWRAIRAVVVPGVRTDRGKP
jgi:GTP-binding protein